MSDWEELKPEIEKRLKEASDSMGDRKWNLFVRLWKTLDPVDSIFYQYHQSGEKRFQYYAERYKANQRFKDRIEQVFQKQIYEIDAKSTLEMWRYLQEEGAEDSFAGRMKQKRHEKQRQSIQKKLQKYAQPGLEIRPETIEGYLELLAEQEIRQKKLLETEKEIPAELLRYFDTHGDCLKEIEESCLVVDYCVGHLSMFTFEKETMQFWKQMMTKAATSSPEEILEPVRTLMQGINRRRSL